MLRNLLVCISYLYFLLLPSNLSGQEINSDCGFNDNEIPLESFKGLGKTLGDNKLRTKAIDDYYFCRVIVDVDYQTFLKYQGDTLFIKNEVALMLQKVSEIYENEINTKLVLVHVNIWKEASKDPYNNISDISTMLNNLRTVYTNNSVLSKIQSDVIMYLNTKGFTGAGGLASGKYNVSPWQNVSTIAHEIGHNFGSAHTQSCNWPGGPLDYCYAVEGTCYTESLDNIKGSLMSYCNRRLNNFHPVSAELMTRNASTRYIKANVISESIKLSENWIFNTGLYFAWNPVVQAEKYILELSEVPNFESLAFSDSTEQAYIVFPYLKKNKKYYLRIKPKNRLSQGTWSNTMNVDTPELVEAPRPLLPETNIINLSGTNINLVFSKIDGATEYQIETVGYSSSSTSFSFDLNKISRKSTTNSLTLSITNEAFTWRVRAVIGSQLSAWSEAYTHWLKPSSNNIDLSLIAINGYPLSFPINYLSGIGDILQTKVILSENQDFSSPIISDVLQTSKYATQLNYPYYLQNLKPNTSYYVKFEEYNLDSYNVIGMPKGLVRFTETSFKTGQDEQNQNFTFINQANSINLSRTLRKIVFNDNVAFVSTAEGVIKMNLDGKGAQLYNRDNSNGALGNILPDLKTDLAGNLWLLTQVSKRISFNGAFPNTTFRLAKFDPNTLKLLSFNDFVGSGNTSFVNFDPETQYLSNNTTSIHKVLKDSTETVIALPTNVKMNTPVVWGKNGAWMLARNSNNNLDEIYYFEYKTNTLEKLNNTNSPLANRISQIFEDTDGNLWVINVGQDVLLKYYSSKTWEKQNFAIAGIIKIIGVNNGTVFLENTSSGIRSVYAWSNQTAKFVENIPLVSTSTSSLQLDKSGKIWLLQTDKLLKINPCFNVKVPILSTNKVNIIKGEEIRITSQGCNSIRWLQGNQVLVSNNLILDLKPSESAIYKAQCTDNECSSDISNAIELNVVSLSFNGLNKKELCINETLGLTLNTQGNFASSNNMSAVLSRGNQTFTSILNKDKNLYITQLPKEILPGNYWVKVESSDPKIASLDSFAVQIHDTPTISILGSKDIFVFDSTNIEVKFTGKAPFKFKLNEKDFEIFNQNSLIINVKPLEPKVFTYSITNFSDFNCASGLIKGESEIRINARIDPKVSNRWVRFYPVPVQNILSIDVYNKPGTKLNMSLVNILGQTIKEEVFPISGYLDKINVDMKDVSSGVYFLWIDTGKRKEMFRIIK